MVWDVLSKFAAGLVDIAMCNTQPESQAQGSEQPTTFDGQVRLGLSGGVEVTESCTDKDHCQSRTTKELRPKQPALGSSEWQSTTIDQADQTGGVENIGFVHVNGVFAFVTVLAAAAGKSHLNILHVQAPTRTRLSQRRDLRPPTESFEGLSKAWKRHTHARANEARTLSGPNAHYMLC